MRLGVLEAKNRLSELLEKVAAGEEVIITRRGAAIARLTGIDRRATAEEAERLIERARRLRASADFTSNVLQNRLDRDEGRRF